MTPLLADSLADTVGFDLLDGPLAREVNVTLSTALKSAVVFAGGTAPLEIFRDSVRQAIGRIQAHGRADLLLRFLGDGPIEDEGKKDQLRSKRLTDDETAAVTGFIHGHMVNSFKGTLTELLAVGPCLRLLRELKADSRLPRHAQLYVGDTVWSVKGETRVFAKGADMHILVPPRTARTPATLGLAGVIEVKSYFQTAERLKRQLDHHFSRGRRGLRVGGEDYFPPQIAVTGMAGQPVRISVTPAGWSLPRIFRFEIEDGRRFLHVDPPLPPWEEDEVEPVGDNAWHLTLRWSKEALDAAAYGMTFWFMEKVGEALYADGVPEGWKPMSPAAAGQNAAKMMLYYAILRARNRRDEQRAIAIYNSYGFGCALGMNFRNKDGRREMLWPEDLDEILAHGKNKDGCRVV